MLVKNTIISRIIIGLFLIMLTCWLPASGADNVSVIPVTTPFITVDPIGNHTVDDVILLNGTTNIPANETLHIASGGSLTSAGIHGTQFRTNVNVSLRKSGVNFWTCNISPTLWTSKGLNWESHDVKYFETGDYIVIISSKKFNITSEARIIINPTKKSNASVSSSQIPSTIVVPLDQTLVNTTSSKATPATSLPFFLPFWGIAGIIFIHSVLRKTWG